MIENPSAATSRPRAVSPPVPPAGLLARGLPFGLALAAAAALFLGLGIRGALSDWWWCDEGFTWDLIQRSPLGIIQGTAADVHPPLYYLALHAWCQVWPALEAMKAFSLVCGLAGLLLAAWTGCLLAGRRAGMLIAFLWATCPMILHYSQDARMYPMGLALETLAVAGWALAPRRPRLGWLLFVVGLAGAMYTQNLCLLFAAALLGGEFLRAVAVYFAARRESTFTQSAIGNPQSAIAAGAGAGGGVCAPRESAILWVVTAGFAVALIYLPWSFVLRAQMRSAGIAHFFHAHTVWELIVKAVYYPYTLLQDSRGHRWGWFPGALLLAGFPLLFAWGALAAAWRSRFRRVEPRPPAMLAWAALAPLLFASLYSQYVSPIFEMSRHGLLYIPFLLPAAGFWLAARQRWRAARLATAALIVLCAGFAWQSLGKSRDLDFRPVREALLKHVPAGAPLYFYPSFYRVAGQLWRPLSAADVNYLSPIPAHLTSCTLVLVPGSWGVREDVTRQAKLILGKAAAVREIYTSHDIVAWQLSGLRDGALAGLLRREPGFGIDLLEQQAGRWIPSPRWKAADLQKYVSPRGGLHGFSPINPAWQGVRLAAERSSITLPAAGFAPGAFRALMLGGHYIPKKGNGRLTLKLDGREILGGPAGRGEFLAARLLPPGSDASGAALEISREDVVHDFAPGGDAPPGIYLTWGGWRELKPEEYQRPGFDGLYYDVGALGDELYLRQGFAEGGAPPLAERRWTGGRFVAELAVWPEREANEVVLCGRLPAAVRERKVELVIDEGEAGRELRAAAKFVKSDEGEYALRLPQPLAPGVHRLAFTVGTCSPAEAIPGADGLRLGFDLDGIGLRRKK